MRRRLRRKTICPAALCLLWAGLSASLADGGQLLPIDAPTCAARNRIVMAEARGAGGGSALGRLVPTLAPDASRSERVCAGLIVVSLAELLFARGEYPDAEAFARRAVDIIENVVPADNPLLLTPLHGLARALIAQGKKTAARSALGRMNAIQSDLPGHRALVHQVTATLSEAEGRRPEAESDYLAALHAWEEAGQGGGMEASDLMHALGLLYLADGRLTDAERFLNRAMEIAHSSRAAMPIDIMKILNTRAIVYMRQQAHRAAEADFREALSMAERDTASGGSLECILNNYAQFLRHTGRKREARVLEERSAALSSRPVQDSLVDVAVLRKKGK